MRLTQLFSAQWPTVVEWQVSTVRSTDGRAEERTNLGFEVKKAEMER